ncbi:pimeloyl-ACP methyl ester carboxylesterase [Nocardioides thalensis]|uniref:Pimeloyl-ACP methyl ester carboxylesterase n=1 Tax=Nocardioides thalensis TaxID=1914755 RepID=A0A853BWM5_9ACTN|nr:epoxide hydrolase family protein [Nocardioides thalensis]NYJ00320.1 pimeloyl-ACP methyl ester carboxylesterase [Nocardioides thalensis]
MSMQSKPWVRDFTIRVDDEVLDDLRRRLREARWPRRETVEDWSQGIPLAVVQDMCDYWASGYDWREREERLNSLPQRLVRIDDLDIHCVHVRSRHPDATPIVLTHGWPGSFVEYVGLVDELVDPASGSAEDAFHVVIPSLPGYGFSSQPQAPGWGIERIARAWAELMTALGYERFGAVGSDWGTSVSASLGEQFPDRVLGLCLVPPLAAPDPATFDDLTAQERAALADLETANATGSAYSAMHATRPQTAAYGLTDSPAGLCAWILEKFWSWTDHDGDLYDVIDRDTILDDLTIYWVTGTAASSGRLYWESFEEIHRIFTEDVPSVIDVPVAGAIFPREVPRASRRWAERRFPNIVQWREHDRGGHFAALERPQALVADVRDFFATLHRRYRADP